MVTRTTPTPEVAGAQRFDELPDVLTVSEVASVLRLGRNATYEAIQRGEIPAVKFGRRLLVPKAALIRCLEPSPQSPSISRPLAAAIR